jgi:hypothetical protein
VLRLVRVKVSTSLALAATLVKLAVLSALAYDAF